jgi:hypothetical protein
MAIQETVPSETFTVKDSGQHDCQLQFTPLPDSDNGDKFAEKISFGETTKFVLSLLW